jgi:transcriptional regulator with XRE-family HTH domain
MDRLLSAADVERLADEAGLSVAELCKRAKIAHTTFYRWRTGRTSPSLDVYCRLQDALRAAAAAAE